MQLFVASGTDSLNDIFSVFYQELFWERDQRNGVVFETERLSAVCATEMDVVYMTMVGASADTVFLCSRRVVCFVEEMMLCEES